MVDSFLLAHQIDPLLYDVGSALSPISIRDQILRGQMLVDRACETGLIDAERALLVIGAGAAGVSAGLRSASRGVQTLLIERENGPFGRQAECQTRWIDPTQYDWPLTHWRVGRCPPWEPPSFALAWGKNHAGDLARDWRDILALSEVRYRRFLRVKYGVTVQAFRYLPGAPVGRIEFSLSDGANETQPSFGMAVIAKGPGAEDCTVTAQGTSYSGIRFWDNDTFEQADLGVPGSGLLRVLISGGGDGALQDFLRIVTGCRGAGELFEDLWEAGAGEALQQIGPRIQTAEDQAQRAYAWGARPDHDHAVHLRLQAVHQDVVTELVDSPAWTTVSTVLARRTRSRRLGAIRLAHSCSHFSNCYGLNRFLVLLVAAYIRKTHGYNPFASGTQTASVRGTGHSICEGPSACFGQRHRVMFYPRGCPGGFHAVVNDDDFDIVIVRHGLKTQPDIFPTAEHPRRQLLPYHAS